MGKIIALLTACLAACTPAKIASFADRVAEADRLETTPAGLRFVTAVLSEHGDAIKQFVGECYASHAAIEKDAFVLVADIDPGGAFTQVAAQPESAPSRCYAAKIDALQTHAARPAGFEDKAYPVVLKIRYNK